ncbi:MAG: signal recognition particle-docking protein FtsY, partial [Mycobacterium sp.]|nr:signal recognition particle-docking protein FtsY [Mycobacterium sp.]
MSQGLWIAVAVIAVLIVVALVIGSLRYRRRQVSLRGRPETSLEAATPADRSGGYTASTGITFTQSSGLDTTGLPGVGDDAAVPRDSVKRPIAQVHLPEPPVSPETAETITRDAGVIPPTVGELGAIAPTAGRLERLRGRLAKSQSVFGRSMLGLLGGGDLDEDSWQDVEDTLL